MLITRDKKNFRPYLFLLILTIVLISSSGYLNADTSGNENKLNVDYLKRFGRDALNVVTSPFHWRGKDFFTLSAVVGSGVLFFALDNHIKDWVDSANTGLYDDIWESVTNTGNGVFIGGLLASYYIVGEIFRLDNMRKIALLGVESFIISGALIGILKYTIGRARPFTGESKGTFSPFSSSSRNYSFPSGHSAAAFSVATVIAEYSKEFLVDVVAYGMATLVAMSRIHKNKHWASDILFGSAIGYFVGKKISDLNRSEGADRLNIGFQFGRQKQVLSLSYSF